MIAYKPDNDLCGQEGPPLQPCAVDNLFRGAAFAFTFHRNILFFATLFLPLLSVFHHLVSLRRGDTSSPSSSINTSLLVCLDFRREEEEETSLDVHAHPAALTSPPPQFSPSAAIPCSLCNPFRSGAAARLALSNCQ